MKLLPVIAIVFFASVSVKANLVNYYKVDCIYDSGPVDPVKNEFIKRIPFIFERYPSPVQWKVVEKGSGYFIVKLTAKNSREIKGWIDTLESEGQNLVSSVGQVKPSDLKGSCNKKMKKT